MKKMPIKWIRKTLKKILLKSTKNMKLSAFFSGFRGHPTNFVRFLFDSQFFLSFNFYFGHKTP